MTSTSHDPTARLRRYRERTRARGEESERPKRESSTWARIGLLALGGVLIAIGIAGLVLPGIQGVITIVAGLVVVSLGSRTAHRWTRRRLRRWPQVLDRYDKTRRLLRRRFRRRRVVFEGGCSDPPPPQERGPAGTESGPSAPHKRP